MSIILHQGGIFASISLVENTKPKQANQNDLLWEKHWGVNDICIFEPFGFTSFCHFLSVGANSSSRTRTIDLEIMRRVFYHCADTASFFSLPGLGSKPSIF
jgi:hypothetical protein